MERIKKQESPILRLTRWQVEASLSKKSSKELPKCENWTIYGVDAEGNERVYAQVPYEQYEKWSKTDHLWRQAQSAMFGRLLSDPITRDTVIKIISKQLWKKVIRIRRLGSGMPCLNRPKRNSWLNQKLNFEPS